MLKLTAEYKNIFGDACRSETALDLGATKSGVAGDFKNIGKVQTDILLKMENAV